MASLMRDILPAQMPALSPCRQRCTSGSVIHYEIRKRIDGPENIVTDVFVAECHIESGFYKGDYFQNSERIDRTSIEQAIRCSYGIRPRARKGIINEIFNYFRCFDICVHFSPRIIAVFSALYMISPLPSSGTLNLLISGNNSLNDFSHHFVAIISLIFSSG